MNPGRVTASPPEWRPLLVAAALSGAVAALAGCVFGGSHEGGSGQWSDAKPDDEGVYAYDGDELVRLDGDAEWEEKTWDERSNLPPGIELVIRDSALEDVDIVGMVGVQKVAWVRSVVTGNGEVAPVSGSQWQSAPLPAFAVPLDFAERTEPDLIRARARQPLEPGLYEIHVDNGKGPRTARFGVGWPEVDRQAYASSVCVDRYLAAEAGYRPCGEQSPASGGNPLQIFLVKPETREIGSGRSMVISGVIVNNSNRTQSVPMLTAELRDPNGRPLTRWRFEAASSELEPGQSTSFRTEVEDTSRQVHSVNVNFASTQAFN